MIRLLFVILVIFLPCVSSASDVNMLNAVSKSFLQYEEKYNNCIESAKRNQVSSDVVEHIKELDVDLSVSVGYLYSQALYKCSFNELSSLMRLILIIDKSDPNNHQMTQAKAEEIKNILFNSVDFRLESKFQALPEEKKGILLGIVAKVEPFDMIALYDSIQNN